MRLILTLGILVISNRAWAADPAALEDAKRRLAEKDVQRQKDREKVVEISAGELDDLRARIAQLEAQLRALQPKQANAAPRPARMMIEIGMTRDEVMSFIKRRPEYRIVSMGASSGVSKSTEVVNVRRDSTLDRNATTATLKGRSSNPATEPKTEVSNINDNEASQTQIDRVQSTGQRETIRVQKTGKQRVQTGTKTNALGRSQAVYGNREVVEGTISVVLVDGVVTSVDASDGRQ
jgi:hypothetical protein